MCVCACVVAVPEISRGGVVCLLLPYPFVYGLTHVLSTENLSCRVFFTSCLHVELHGDSCPVSGPALLPNGEYGRGGYFVHECFDRRNDTPGTRRLLSKCLCVFSGADSWHCTALYCALLYCNVQ